MAQLFLLVGLPAILQGLGPSINNKKNAENEIKRQQGICDEISNTTTQLQKLKNINSLLQQTEINQDEIKKQMMDYNDSILIYKQQISDLKRENLIKLATLGLTYIVIIFFLYTVIVKKKHNLNLKLSKIH